MKAWHKGRRLASGLFSHHCFILQHHLLTKVSDLFGLKHEAQRELRKVFTGTMAFLQTWQMSELTISPMVLSGNLWVATCSSLDLCSSWSGHLFYFYPLKIGWYLQFITADDYLHLQATLWLFPSLSYPSLVHEKQSCILPLIYVGSTHSVQSLLCLLYIANKAMSYTIHCSARNQTPDQCVCLC